MKNYSYKNLLLLTAMLLLGSAWGNPLPNRIGLTVSANGEEILDLKAGIAWRRCPEGMRFEADACVGSPILFNYHGAEQYLKEKTTGSGVKWRLPTSREMSDLIDKSSIDPKAARLMLPYKAFAGYWTSTRHAGFSEYSSGVVYSNGRVYDYFRSGNFFAHLVRTI